MTVYPEEPTRHCDILMKGGITSGVIYPLAVCELAKQYGLRSVGGSSAGAIAAAAAAAAESNPSRQAGFTRLEELPDDITEELPDGTAVLARLFQPQRSTAPLYKAFTAGLGRSGTARTLAMVWGALTGFYRSALIGAIPGAVLLVLGIARRARAVGRDHRGCGGAVGGRRGRGRGWCSAQPCGPGAGERFRAVQRHAGTSSKGPEALSPWLHRTIQELARPIGSGRGRRSRLADLWGSRGGGHQVADDDHEPDPAAADADALAGARVLLPPRRVPRLVPGRGRPVDDRLMSRRCRIRTTASERGRATCAVHKPHRCCLSHTRLTCPSSSPPG